MPPPSNPSRAAAVSRQARKKRLHGANAKCKDCQTTDVSVLVVRSRPKLCFNCKAKRAGTPVTELHHPAGRSNHNYTVRIPLNSHRRLSDSQTDWSTGTLTNSAGCPLRAAAAWIKGFVELFREMAEQFLLTIAEFLELLSDWMIEQHGEGWWLATDMQRYAPAG